VLACQTIGLFGKFHQRKIVLFYYRDFRTINGLGSIFGLAVNMAVSFFFLKYFHNMPQKPSSTPKRPNSGFKSIGRPSIGASSRA
jgi:hypothetical protein